MFPLINFHKLEQGVNTIAGDFVGQLHYITFHFISINYIIFHCITLLARCEYYSRRPCWAITLDKHSNTVKIARLAQIKLSSHNVTQDVNNVSMSQWTNVENVSMRTCEKCHNQKMWKISQWEDVNNVTQDVNQNFIGDECEKGEDHDLDGFLGHYHRHINYHHHHCHHCCHHDSHHHCHHDSHNVDVDHPRWGRQLPKGVQRQPAGFWQRWWKYNTIQI